MAKTEVWYPENSTTKVYDFIDKEDAAGTIDGSGSIFILANTPSAPVGTQFETNGSALTQYYSASGSIARRDILVYKYLNSTYTEWNTATEGSIISTDTGSLVFETAPTTAQADTIAVSYATNESEKSKETLSVSETGGERAVEFIQTYLAYQIKVNKTQQPFTIDVETLKSNLDFAEMVYGKKVTEGITANGSLYTIQGASVRQDKLFVVDSNDPDTSNRLMRLYWNVSGTSINVDGAAEDNFSEKITFQCSAADSVQLLHEV